MAWAAGGSRSPRWAARVLIGEVDGDLTDRRGEADPAVLVAGHFDGLGGQDGRNVGRPSERNGMMVG